MDFPPEVNVIPSAARDRLERGSILVERIPRCVRDDAAHAYLILYAFASTSATRSISSTVLYSVRAQPDRPLAEAADDARRLERGGRRRATIGRRQAENRRAVLAPRRGDACAAPRGPLQHRLVQARRCPAIRSTPSLEQQSQRRVQPGEVLVRERDHLEPARVAAERVPYSVSRLKSSVPSNAIHPVSGGLQLARSARGAHR